MPRVPRRFLSSARLTRFFALLAAYLLLLSSITPFAQARYGLWQGFQSPLLLQGRGSGPRPQPGPPEASLPNLDEARERDYPEPRAPEPIHSTMRSPRNPMEPRNGRRVGDPLPQPGERGALNHQEDGAEKSARNRQKKNRFTVAVSSTKDSSPRSKAERKQRSSHHAMRKARPIAAMALVPDDQFVSNFFQWALLRQPNSTEATYWHNMVRAAFPQGNASVLLATRELGKTLFESNEYAARGRSDYWYVYDLYKTYLMRDPDQGGWDFWTSQVPSMGRENVRRAFEFSVEYSNLVATLAPNGSIIGAVSSLLTARVDPYTNRVSRSSHASAVWSATLLSLPGRAGLDLGLTLAQASPVFTRSGPYLYFDEDTGSPSPGFRLGFPTVQELSFNAALGQRAFLLITSAGSRIELRQVGTSNTYEAADSSYLQLIDYGSSLLVRTTDGTQLTYGGFNNEYRVTQVKDRNGNFLTISNNSIGQITSITDTLGRVVNFNYDVNANLLSITQQWGTQTHTWATFGWSTHTMQTSFSNVQVVGAPNNSQWPVLTQVGFPDGSRFNFEYTNWLQVSVIRRYTADNVQRSYQVNQYETPADNCPRLTHTRVWAENWTGLNGVPSEVVTQYDDASGVRVVTAPDGTIYKEFYGTGWQRGLVTQSEVWSGGVRKKWTTTAWTQDNTGVSYELNPRVIETNVYDDANNRRRTTISYNAVVVGATTIRLPEMVREYGGVNGDQLLRRHVTLYRWDQAMMDRRVIGLVGRQEVYEGESTLMSMIEYHYDWVSGYMQAIAPGVQHDTANYGAGLGAGRGILVAIFRYNANNTNEGIWVRTFGYNLAGQTVWTADATGHRTDISYTDSFSDGLNRNTLAYPTTVTDPDGHNSYFKYNFDFGAVTRTQGPPPAGQSQGVIQAMLYDSAGRIERVTTENNSAYTRYVYGPNYRLTFATVNNVADDAYTVHHFDGVGRVYATAGYHPGSAGGYKAQLSYFDAMGRVMKQSNPTEIRSDWLPWGDDAAGWIFTQQTYDWQGRPLVTTNTDGTTKEASYGGCGCAGGEVVTLTDEGTISGGVAKRRQQKIYADVLGRTVKTEVLNWQGGNVYSATVNTYNARDQVTQIRQYAGAEGSSTYQDTIMTYDGHGRLQTRKLPEQNAGTSTVWDYNADDTIQKITDSRGASQTFTYNNRHMVTGVTYGVPGGVVATPNVSYSYDAAGNRTAMNDGLGSVSYSYNQLSQMTSETRTFTGLGTYTLSYGYNLRGQLTSITDPFNYSTSYGRDSVGQLNTVSGSPFGGVTQYVTGIQYRAWGAQRQISYGNGRVASLQYDGRLRPTQYSLSSVMTRSYSYYADARLSFSGSIEDQQFNRNYQHDLAGRLTQNETIAGPYADYITYDAFNNMTSRAGWHWTNFINFSATYTNNKNTTWQYDAEGNVTNNGEQQFQYDAAGRMRILSTVSYSTEVLYDGDGQVVRPTFSTLYSVRSSVLGGRVVTELLSNGQRNRGYVYAEGEIVAMQYQATQHVVWEHRDAANQSLRMTGSGGWMVDAAEMNSTGANVGMEDPYPADPGFTGDDTDGVYPHFGSPTRPGTGCVRDGIPMDCNELFGRLSSFSRYYLLANAAIPRLRNYEVDYGEGPPEDFGLDWESALATHLRARDTILRRNWIINDSSWAGFFLLFPNQPFPQKPQVIRVPLDVDKLKGLIQDRLKHGDCAEYVGKLINKAAELSGGTEPAESTDIMTLFEKIRSQPNGGILFDTNEVPGHPEVPQVAGGGGWAWGSYLLGNAMINVYTMGYYTDNPSAAARIPYEYGLRGLHEVIHKSGMSWGYTEAQLTQAARALEPDAKYAHWNLALKAHCVPIKFH